MKATPHTARSGRLVRNAACFGTLFALAAPADAGNRRFAYSYETTTMAAGAMELENWITYKGHFGLTTTAMWQMTHLDGEPDFQIRTLFSIDF